MVRTRIPKDNVAAIQGLFWLFGLLAVTVTYAASPEAVLTSVQRINAEELIDLAADDPNLLVVDARAESMRHEGFIEQSISLPILQADCARLAKQISAPDQAVVFYCNAMECGYGNQVAKLAVHCGYSHFYWLKEGFEGWKQKGYPYLKYER